MSARMTQTRSISRALPVLDVLVPPAETAAPRAPLEAADERLAEYRPDERARTNHLIPAEERQQPNHQADDARVKRQPDPHIAQEAAPEAQLGERAALNQPPDDDKCQQGAASKHGLRGAACVAPEISNLVRAVHTRHVSVRVGDHGGARAR